MVTKYTSFDDAYQDILLDLYKNGKTCKPRDIETKEILGYNFIITDPINRLTNIKARGLNLYYAIGNFLWVMSQSNDLEYINYYNPRGSIFSDDGTTLRGAYGKRIFDMDGVNQFHNCIQELSLDSDSRRAIITIHLPQHDWAGSLDTPCTANLQFFIRENKLIMLTNMRSQSAAMVMPYDIFLMTMIQEFMACILKVEVGEYHHHCGSIHYYQREWEIVERIIGEHYSLPWFPKMPKETNMKILKRVIAFESLARKTARDIKKSAISDFNVGSFLCKELDDLLLPNYWNDICKVLIYQAIQYSGNNAYHRIDLPAHFINFI